jgi:1,4-alpha-glucan branching enzyme
MESIVAAIQNHDFIGNHPAGLRLHQTTSPDAQRAAAALLLLSPSIPMLFMGEEFATDSPFYFFADFGDPGIRRAVEKGRKAEHPQHDWKHAVSPLSESAFRDSKIGATKGGNPEMLKWYRKLIAIRKSWIKAGYLRSENLDASWDSARSVGVLQYRSESFAEQRFVIARLHPVTEEPSLLSVEISGEILLNHNYDSTMNCAGSFTVVVGTGSVEIG